ncbi:hypothetical protein RUM44_007670 [Polyplax serrata]|uniref:E3 ubiquitin-protein ligase FANCL n=1 Tax=Polyplax serrata TaxID=468196 RepID=A0ABR1BA84_POLSC
MVLVQVGTSFRGLVTVGNRKYSFELAKGKEITNSTIKLSWRLKKLLNHRLDCFLENEFKNPYDFHDKFTEFVRETLKNDKRNSEDWLKNPLGFCTLITSLQEDLKTSGKYIKDVNIDKMILTVEMVDAQFRTHTAVLKLSEGYPKEPVKVEQINLPSAKTLFNEDKFDFEKAHTVDDFCKQFEKAIVAFQDFWNIISPIDIHCCTLDPPHPTYCDTYRRIKLSNTLSLGLTLDPLRPKQMPKMKLFGCKEDIDKQRDILQKNLEKELWDCQEDLIHNLNKILELLIPNKIYGDHIDRLGITHRSECAICFKERLNDELPNEMCNEPGCKSIYHTLCLFTYLSSVPKNREYFGMMQGECPNCNAAISCPVTTTIAESK